MKLSSLAAAALFALCGAGAYADSTSVSPAAADTVASMPAADPGDLVTRISDDGKVMQVQEADGSWTTLKLSQTSDIAMNVTDGKEVGQFVQLSESANTNCATNGCVELAWWGGWHHHHFWHWHHHDWYPHRHFHFGGWGYHHWHHWHHGW